MADRPLSKLPANEPTKRVRALKQCDPDDPNDSAFSFVSALILILCFFGALFCDFCRTSLISFCPSSMPLSHQITKYNVPLEEAMDKCGATVTPRAMYNRVGRYQQQMAANGIGMAANGIDTAGQDSASKFPTASCEDTSILCRMQYVLYIGYSKQ